MKLFPLILISLFLTSAVMAQDKEALKEVEKEIIAEKEGKSKKGVFSKLNVFGKDKKEAVADSSDGGIVVDGKKAGKYKPAKDDKVDPDKKELQDYKKAMDAEKAPVFKDKYGRPINSGPRFESDRQIKKVNRRNEAKLKNKEKKKSKKPSRRTYRYD
ncbi:hypothetical protein [Luteibaculum oceani]|uniref:Uncharacterized protein n=1 Tax=Luteibaculum oceani TaxID=1294296 RepID=A0A5C6UVF6_9FLAO|nr:hypothetical protein [Luteibaculum oceani]TXC76949.1 hypothetical protein FRX97_10060 [Luteibaculum oceani]